MIERRITLFGRVSVRAGKKTTDDFSTAHCRNLLVFLAMYPDADHPRDRLVSALWPTRHDGSTRNRLSVTLYHLRKTLDALDPELADMIVSRRATLRLDSSLVRSDLRTFRQAMQQARRSPDDPAKRRHYARAVREYSGPLAPEVNEEWSLARQVESAEMFQEATVWLAQDMAAHGDQAAARAFLSHALDVEPYAEKATEMLTDWYAQNGQFEMAVSCAKRLRRALAAHGRPPSRSMLDRIDELNVILAERSRAMVFADERVVTVLACAGASAEEVTEACANHGGQPVPDENSALFHHPMMAMEAGRELLRTVPESRVFLYTTVMALDDPLPVAARMGARALRGRGIFGSESFAALARQKGIESLEEVSQGVRVWRLA